MNQKISIICAVFNNASGLKTTLENIAQQTYDNYEVIVIDAASTDNTKDVISQFSNLITYSSSEPDRGIYDGMNKGIAKATGEWIVFMNGGDIFYSNETLSNVASEFDESTDVIYGQNIHAFPDGVKKLRKHNGIKHIWKGLQFSHQSMYARRQLFVDYPYKFEYKLAADYDFIMHCVYAGKQFKKLDFPLSITEPGGRSDKKRVQLFEEQLKIYRSYERNIFREMALLTRLFLAKILNFSLLQKLSNKG